MALSRTQIDKLGQRLRQGPTTDSDLHLLDEYRRSFIEPYDFVVRTIRTTLSLEPTGRPAKSTSSIVQKLRRESIRLSQIQDIAGCRVLVDNRLEQDNVATGIRGRFSEISLVDRRATPSHGYRAVHLIVEAIGKPVEIQLRTTLQHLWAELSERLSDRYGADIKYGAGDHETRYELWEASEFIAAIEALEHRVMLKYPSPKLQPIAGAELDADLRRLVEAVGGWSGAGSPNDDLAQLIVRKKRNLSDYLIDSIMSLSEDNADDFSN